MSAAIWPWLARKELASAAVTLTTTVIGRCSRAVFSSRTIRSGGRHRAHRVPRLGHMVRRWHADPFGFLRPWDEVPALMASAPPTTPPSTGTGVVAFLTG